MAMTNTTEDELRSQIAQIRAHRHSLNVHERMLEDNLRNTITEEWEPGDVINVVNDAYSGKYRPNAGFPGTITLWVDFMDPMGLGECDFSVYSNQFENWSLRARQEAGKL